MGFYKNHVAAFLSFPTNMSPPPFGWDPPNYGRQRPERVPPCSKGRQTAQKSPKNKK